MNFISNFTCVHRPNVVLFYCQWPWPLHVIFFPHFIKFSLLPLEDNLTANGYFKILHIKTTNFNLLCSCCLYYPWFLAGQWINPFRYIFSLYIKVKPILDKAVPFFTRNKKVFIRRMNIYVFVELLIEMGFIFTMIAIKQ